MATEAIEHCVNMVCGRSFPRKVNFCPYCGTRQAAAAGFEQPRPAAPQSPFPPQSPSARPAAPLHALQPAAAASEPQPSAPKAHSAAAASGPSPAAAPEPPPSAPKAQPAVAASRPKANFGKKYLRIPELPPGLDAGGPTARPPLQRPVSKTTWALVVLGLAAIWIIAKPDDPGKKLEARVGQAIALTAECKIDIARAELSSLKTDKATPAQLKRLQEAIGATAPGCEKKRLRSKAWTDLRLVLESAVESGALDRAASRLAAFSKKWGEDADTREWDSRIDIKRGERLLDEADACLKKNDRACIENKLAAAERLQRAELVPRIQLLRDELSRLLEATILEQASPPPAPPALRNAPPVISTAPQMAQSAQQARQILADAERELARENYKSAMDKAEICATMIDVGNRECLGLRQRAERLNRDMLRCVASGAEWINGRCQ